MEEPQTNIKPGEDELEEKVQATKDKNPEKDCCDYDWVITTKFLTHDAKDIQEWKRRRQKYDDMGMDVEKPPKQSKMYQFHIREVESVVAYEDEDFGDITVIHKYNGNQVPILESFEDIARVHKKYNEYKDDLLEESNLRRR